MTDIDWSEAPEGYPIWIQDLSPDKAFDGSGWHRDDGDRYADRNGRYWLKPESDHYRVHTNPAEPWTGSGLPPVGIDCEYMKRGCAKWSYCTVIAHHDGGAVVAVHEDDLSYSYWNDSSHFRPIRTPEQIAAQDALDEIERLYSEGGPAAVYDAGYRKQEKPE